MRESAIVRLDQHVTPTDDRKYQTEVLRGTSMWAPSELSTSLKYYVYRWRPQEPCRQLRHHMQWFKFAQDNYCIIVKLNHFSFFIIYTVKKIALLWVRSIWSIGAHLWSHAAVSNFLSRLVHSQSRKGQYMYCTVYVPAFCCTRLCTVQCLRGSQPRAKSLGNFNSYASSINGMD